MRTAKALSPDQVKARFKEQGTTITAWAESNGFRPHAVYQVLNGFTKSNRGNAHQIAVALGIKPQPSAN